MEKLRPRVSKISAHAGGVSAHFGGVIFECRAHGDIQAKRISLLQKKSIHAGGLCHSLYSVSGMKFSVNAPVAVCKKNMVADILDKRRAAFEVPGQSLGGCKGVSHAPGF